MTKNARIVHGYILLGDPNWLEESLSSYYDLVDKIIAVYDVNGLSWSGVDIFDRISKCKSILCALDKDNKVEYLSGDFSVTDTKLMDAETAMRNAGVVQASMGSDIVLQIDTDEIVPDLHYFGSCLDLWYTSGEPGCEYAARWLYVRVFGYSFLEMSTRKLNYWDAIPGPVAIRSNQSVSYARQISGKCRRFSPLSKTDAIPIQKTIVHPSMIQSTSDIDFKLLKLSGHSRDMDMKRRVRMWKIARVFPVLIPIWTALFPTFGTYRLVNLGYCCDLLKNINKYYK
jgi:hypothetical protein